MEYSKTQQYRKVMKPLLERQRRARINKCLDQLKDLLNDCLKHDKNEQILRLEKADILEYTVEYLRKTKIEQSSLDKNISTIKNSFRNGYVYAANEVSKAMASTRGIDISLGTKLMSHLGNKLNCLQQETEEIQQTKVKRCYSPLNIETQNCNISTLTTISPVSSGYCSDYYSSSNSTSPVLCEEYYGNSLNNIWRPW